MFNAKLLLILILTLPTITLTSCKGNSPGYLFTIIFIVLPLGWIGYSLLKKVEENTDSLYVIENQLKNLTDKVEELEENLSKTAKTTTRSRKTTTKK
ncbi:MAG: hypothetical protein GTO02_22070 [Candidatus Dadabacteria bacterium]|nr:hypothetical protein [Candidatus Dadabacteria bacterium]NIQ16970.1 hypothetical protein [Candidatus Dadabacteria bacterium]